MIDLVMPRLSDTMEEGTILRWLKADGEEVTRGEELVEIETDKATMIYESDLAGVLQIVAGEGATLAVGELIATVQGAGESAGPPPETAQPAPDGQPSDARGVTTDTGAQTQREERSPLERGAAAEERVRASPLARRMASDSGIDLHELRGSGPGGRIVKADVLASGAGAEDDASHVPLAETIASSEPGPSQPRPATAKGQSSEVELTRTQQTIARRMAESKATIPDFAIRVDVDMEACVALRGELKRLSHSAPGEEQVAGGTLATPTYNDMVVKASALALREHPRANASYRDGRLQLHSRVNVGVAVAVAEALVVPTVFDADSKALGEIARETRRLAERVREQTITPPELGGATFTVSNLGMYGVRDFSAIINPPQAAILSVGSLEPRAVAHEGEVVARNTMILTLVCDHRILYGADAAQLLARIRELLQAPSALTL